MVGKTNNKRSRNEYTIGWICALPIELAASVGMLDEIHPDLDLARGDRNMYTLGAVAGHNVVVACLPAGSTGITPAATVAANMLRSFPSIRFGLMVGIGGGAPKRRARPNEDIRLGDVVVSIPQGEFGGVVKYDRGKTVAGGEFEHTGMLNMPPAPLTNAVAKLRSMHESKRSAIPRYVSEMITSVMESEDANPDFEEQYRRPDLKYDQLFEADYEHINEAPAKAETEDSGTDGSSLSEEDDIPLPCPHCDATRLAKRKPRKSPDPVIHYGIIASADQVMRHAVTRDAIRKKYGVLCFEMEAAGLMNDFPCLVIRGICDYSDTHKHKIWQRYAAATAAAYAKELLQVVLKEEVDSTVEAAKVLERVEHGIDDIQQKVDHLVRDKARVDRDRILGWLDSGDTHTKRLFDSLDKWQPSTVQKLLQSEEYQGWVAGDVQTLWAPGIAGGGKTVFSSVVVSSLKDAQRSLEQGKRAAIACLFCEYERQKDQTLRSLVLALLRQLADQCEILPDSVTALFSQYESIGSAHLRFEDISLALTATLGEFSEVYIVVDALDECSDGTRRELLAHLAEQQRKSGLRILATARPTVDFKKEFGGECSELDIKADTTDVKTVLDKLIDKSSSFVRTDEELRKRVMDNIAVAVDGMFLLVQPLFDSIISERSRGHIEDAIRRLIESTDKLATVYESALNRIGGQEAGNRDLAHRMLSWVVESKRPLNRKEFLHALAVQVGSSTFREEYVIEDLEDAVALCAGLVVINERSDTVQLMHHTARTYLENPDHRPDWMASWQGAIASACVTYISYTAFEDGPCLEDEDMDKRLEAYPFLPYAAQHWGHHGKDVGKDTAFEDLVMDFLKDIRKFVAANQAMHISGRRDPGYSKWYDKFVTRLHIIAAFGLDGVAERLLPTLDKEEIDLADKDGRTPLHWAAENGHDDVIGVLIQHSANVNIEEDTFGQTPLHLAALNGHARATQKLVENGADTGAFDADGWMPIHVASWMGHESVTSALLEPPPAADAASSSTRPSTSIAAADVCSEDGLTALHCAAAQGHVAIAQLLLQAGADPSAMDDDRWTPMHWAAKKRHDILQPRVLSLKDETSPMLRRFVEIQEELNEVIQQQADVLQDRLATLQRPLGLGFWQNKLAWLPAGIEFNVSDEHGEVLAALQLTSNMQNVTLPWPVWNEIWGAENGEEENEAKDESKKEEEKKKDDMAKVEPPPTKVRFMFAIQDELTAMHCSAECGHAEVCKLLLKHGAKIEQRCSTPIETKFPLDIMTQTTALHLAAFSSHEAMVRLLLEQGADISVLTKPDSEQTQDSEANTESESDSDSDSDSDSRRPRSRSRSRRPRSRSRSYPRRLRPRPRRRNRFGSFNPFPSFNALKGFDTFKNALNDSFYLHGALTAFHCAIVSGSELVMQMLVERGASIRDAAVIASTKTSLPVTPIQLATIVGSAEKVQYLVTQGAEVGDETQHLATFLGRDDIMEILLQNQPADADIDHKVDLSYEEFKVDLSALHIATICRREKIMRMLLDRGASAQDAIFLEIEGDDIVRAELTGLHLTALCRDWRFTDWLLRANADVNARIKITVEGWRTRTIQTEEPAAEADTKKRENEGKKPPKKEAEQGSFQQFLAKTVQNFITLLGDEIKDSAMFGNVARVFKKKEETVPYEFQIDSTALSLAVLSRNVEVVQVLIDHGADVHQESLFRITSWFIRCRALHLAVLWESEGMIGDVLDAGADIEAICYLRVSSKLLLGFSALHIAILLGNAFMVQLLLEKGSDAEKRCIVNKDGENVLSPLHLAMMCGHEDVVAVLLARDVSLLQNYRLRLFSWLDMELSTLHLAALLGSGYILQALLDAGCGDQGSGRIDCHNLHVEFTALHLATLWRHEAVVQSLLDKGHDVNAKCLVKVGSVFSTEVMTIHIAAFVGGRDLTSSLLSAGADIHQALSIDSESFRTQLTPVHIAILSRHRDVLEFLLDSGSDVHASIRARVYDDTDIDLPLLHIAALWKTQVARLLLDKGLDVNAKLLIAGPDTQTEITALHLAAALDKKRLALLLLDAGVDPDARMQVVTDDVNVDMTALHIALGRKSSEMIRLLVSKQPLKEEEYPWMMEGAGSDASSVISERSSVSSGYYSGYSSQYSRRYSPSSGSYYFSSSYDSSTGSPVRPRRRGARFRSPPGSARVGRRFNFDGRRQRRASRSLSPTARFRSRFGSKTPSVRTLSEGSFDETINRRPPFVESVSSRSVSRSPVRVRSVSRPPPPRRFRARSRSRRPPVRRYARSVIISRSPSYRRRRRSRPRRRPRRRRNSQGFSIAARVTNLLSRFVYDPIFGRLDKIVEYASGKKEAKGEIPGTSPAVLGIEEAAVAPAPEVSAQESQSIPKAVDETAPTVAQDVTAEDAAVQKETLLPDRTNLADPSAMLLLNVGNTRIQLTPLHLSSLLEMPHVTEMLLAQGVKNADPNTLLTVMSGSSSLQLPPLHLAILRKSKLTMQHLVRHGADLEGLVDIHVRDFYAKLSPLQIATIVGSWDVAQALLGNRASTEIKHPIGVSRTFFAELSYLQLILLSRRDEVSDILGKSVKINAKAPANVEVYMDTNMSALDAAAVLKDKSMLELFADYEVDISAANLRRSGWLRILALLLASAAKSDLLGNAALFGLKDVDEKTSVKVAVRVTAYFAMQASVTVNLELEASITSLHAACALGNTHIARSLLERDAPIESTCEVNAGDMLVTQLSPLHIAIAVKSQAIVLLLLDKGANPSALAEVNINKAVQADLIAPHLATWLGHDSVSRLLTKGADTVQITIKAKLAPIHIAALTGDEAILMYLLDHGISAESSCTFYLEAKTTSRLDINIEAEIQLTPLHMATSAGRARLIEPLVQNGANIDLPAHVSGTVLLERAGASITRKIRAGGTPLHLAAAMGQLDALKTLLKAGADVHAKSDNGRTPHDWAKTRGRDEAAEILRSHEEKNGTSNGERRRILRETWHGVFSGDRFSAPAVKENKPGLTPPNGEAAGGQNGFKFLREGMGGLFTRWVVQKAKERQDKTKTDGAQYEYDDDGGVD